MVAMAGSRTSVSREVRYVEGWPNSGTGKYVGHTKGFLILRKVGPSRMEYDYWILLSLLKIGRTIVRRLNYRAVIDILWSRLKSASMSSSAAIHLMCKKLKKIFNGLLTRVESRRQEIRGAMTSISDVITPFLVAWELLLAFLFWITTNIPSWTLLWLEKASATALWSRCIFFSLHWGHTKTLEWFLLHYRSLFSRKISSYLWKKNVINRIKAHLFCLYMAPEDIQASERNAALILYKVPSSSVVSSIPFTHFHPVTYWMAYGHSRNGVS